MEVLTLPFSMFETVNRDAPIALATSSILSFLRRRLCECFAPNGERLLRPWRRARWSLRWYYSWSFKSTQRVDLVSEINISGENSRRCGYCGRSAAGGQPARTTWCERPAASAASACWTIPVAGGSRRANGRTGSWCARSRVPPRGRGTSLTGLRYVLQLPERGGYRPGHLARKRSCILSKLGNVDLIR